MPTPWETPPKPVTPWAIPPQPANPLLVKDPATGLWPGQREPNDIPDFLRRQTK